MPAVESPPASSAPSPGAAAEGGRQTLSELLARILDQLSLSAWLPSGVLVFGGLLIGSLRAERGDARAAFAALGGLSLASLVLLLVAVVLATVLTQAFQFEAIRLLEGYWAPGRLRDAIADAGCRRHLARRDAIWSRLDSTADRAFVQAVAAMLAEGVPPDTVAAVTRVYRKQTTVERLPQAERKAVEAHPWRRYAPPDLLRRMDALSGAGSRYPVDDAAVRPTALGNMLRFYEDPIEREIKAPIEGFVQQIFHRLPPGVQADHDQLRQRLDLYCSLVLVFLVIGLAGAGLLSGGEPIAAVAVGFAGVALACVSYRAAVTSARAYGTFLKTLVPFHHAAQETT